MNLSEFRKLNNSNSVKVSDFDQFFKHFAYKKYDNEVNKYIENTLMKDRRYLFVERRGRKIHSKCSKCGGEHHLTHVPKHESFLTCEHCKSRLEVRNIKFSSFRDKSYRSYIHFFNATGDKEIIVAYGLDVVREVMGQSLEDIEVVDEVKFQAKYFFDMKSKSRMIKKDYWNSKKPWYFTSTMYPIIHQSDYFYGYYLESVEKAKKASEQFKYVPKCVVNSYSLIKSLEFYTKFPNIELLINAGFSNLVELKFEGHMTGHTINWKGKTLSKMLRLSRNNIIYFREKKEIDFKNLFLIQELSAKNYNFDEMESARWFLSQSRHLKEVRKILDLGRPSVILRYLRKQRDMYPDVYRYDGNAYADFVDMLSDMETLGLPMTKDNIFPKNLNRHHINLSMTIEVEKNKEFDKAFMKRYKKLNIYEMKVGPYVVMLPKSVNDLVFESKILKHCAHTYIKRYAEGKTNIFFIRKANEKTEPLYTLEISVDMSRVVQCRGKRNIDIENDSAANKAFKMFLNKLKLIPKESDKYARIAN